MIRALRVSMQFLLLAQQLRQSMILSCKGRGGWMELYQWAYEEDFGPVLLSRVTGFGALEDHRQTRVQYPPIQGWGSSDGRASPLS